MAFDPVPLAIGGGAVHSDDVMRKFINGVSRDAQGITLPGNFKVTANAQANGSVNIAPGGMFLRNVQSPGQSYFGQAPTVTSEARSLTTPGHHLIIARVIDPEFAPWQPSGSPGAPNTSVASGPYFEPHVVPGVSASTRLAEQVVSYTAEALALVSNPTGSAAITGSMITDLRRLALPRIGFAYDLQRISGSQPISTSTADQQWHQWPLHSLNVYVPPWATHVQASINIQGILALGPGNVNLRVNFAGMTGDTAYFDTNENVSVSGYEVSPVGAYAEFDVRHLQGQTVVMRMDGKRDVAVNNATGIVLVDFHHQMIFDARFSERVV